MATHFLLKTKKSSERIRGETVILVKTTLVPSGLSNVDQNAVDGG